MLLFVLSAFAVDLDPWLRDVESQLDAAVPSLRTCVTYSKVVSSRHIDILAFELRYRGDGQAQVVGVGQTRMESWITRCMALRLSETSWPEAPIAPATVGFTLHIEQLTPGCLRRRVTGAGEDLSAHFEAAFRLDEAGYLVQSRVVGGDHLGELRDCILNDVERVRFPTGYPGTAPIWIIVEHRRAVAVVESPRVRSG